MIPVRRKQNGAVLLTSLIMLVVLTLFAITMINSSSIGLRIVSSFQAQKVMEQGMQEKMAEFISIPANFLGPTAQPAVCVNGVGASCTGGYYVKVEQMTCVSNAPAPGYSLTDPLVPDDNHFEIRASVIDPVDPTKKYMKIVEGVQVRMLASSCPAAPFVY